MKKAHQHLIKWGLHQGYTIEVVLEDELEYVGKDYNKAIEAIEACDVSEITFLEGENTDAFINQVAWFFCILEYDQEPDETISDYGINEVSTAWYQDYTAHCEKYPINNHYSRSNN